MNGLKWAGLLSILFSLSNLAVFFLGTSFYHFAGISSAEVAKLNPHLTADLPERWLLFSATVQGLFALYTFSAINIVPRLPLLRSIIILFTVFSIILTIDDLILPFTSSIEERYQYWSVWIIISVLQLAITLCSIYGLKQSWRKLSNGANWRESVGIIVGLLIGLLITIYYVPEIYHDWTLTLINEYKDQLSLLPENIDYLIISPWISLPKIILLSLFSALFISKLGQQRRFIYAVLVSFIFLTYILRILPLLSILFTTLPEKMVNIKIATDNLNLILFLLIFSVTLSLLNKASNKQVKVTV